MIEQIIALTIFVLVSVGFIYCSFGWYKEEKKHNQLRAKHKKLIAECCKQKALACFYECELETLKGKDVKR